MTAEHAWAEPFVKLECPLCGTQYPAAANITPNVERELRCQRCLVAALAYLERTQVGQCLLRKDS